MAIVYRKLTDDELDVFITMRIRQLREEGAKEEIDLEPALNLDSRKHDDAIVEKNAVNAEKSLF